MGSVTEVRSEVCAKGPAFDVYRIRNDFPILRRKVHGKPLVYLDNAATTQKPRAVIETLTRCYAEENANIHRGVHLLSERATKAYEDARGKVQRFLNAAESREIVFVLDCDFYVFSGHKLFGPTGVGVLYGKVALLDAMPPYQGGGDMISSVTFEKTHYNVVPYKFEAGTPNITGAIGLGAAIDYLNNIDRDWMATYECDLLASGTDALSQVAHVQLTGTAQKKAGILAFVMDGAHPHDIGTILDQEGIAIRTGHHCCMPLMQWLQVPATARASLALYNTRKEIDALVAALDKVWRVFA